MIFYKNNFLTNNLYDYIVSDKYKNDVTLTNNFVDKEGVFKGKQTSVQEWLDKDSLLVNQIKEELDKIDCITGHNIDGIQVMTSIKPYDVHSDWVVTNNQIPLCDVTEFPPSYTAIIPLITGDYHTIVFEQGAEYKDFYMYKEENNELSNYCSDEDWDNYLSHCHKEDQKYLSIKKIFSWNEKDIFGFDRTLFHSASHHNIPKKGIVVWMSYPTE